MMFVAAAISTLIFITSMTIAAFLAAICKFYENKRIIDEEIVN
jgi:hypothetical protein